MSNMDSSDQYSSRNNSNPKKELQGPRPTPLRINKESHKIKKPPIAPQPKLHQPQAQPRQPVIIYTVSPKIIHTNPSDFMNLVQRLTGLSASSYGSSSSSTDHLQGKNSGIISPAARYATIEKARARVLDHGKEKNQISGEEMILGDDHGVVERTRVNFPGILSPGPALMPSIPTNFFSPPSDPNSMSLFYNFSPSLYSNRNFMEGISFMASPSNFVNVSPLIPSPTTPSLDLYNIFPDFK